MTRFEKFLMFFNIENDPNMISDLYAQSEMTKTYTALLLLANFIALFGLITNSVAVIIGAMLISPLMGPIISFGFAYITSEKQLMRVSMTTMLKSLAYVVLSAALLSYLSPLNDITEQILARTKPNLYDLFIAVFSGLVVAVSFLSKKVNSITILTGVAIATSIIPPLSVVGFGIGTGNWAVSLGSFLLFFTNVVAIVATTALSGIIFGYNYFQNLKDFNYIKKRLVMILLIIAAVSLPLSYTLKQSIENIKIRRVVNQAVAGIKDATVFSINYNKDDKNVLNLNIALASGKPFTKEELVALKAGIESRLNLRSVVTVTQVALKEDVLNNKTAVVQEKRTAGDGSVSSAALGLRDKTDEMSKRLEPLIAPYPMTGYSLTINSDKTALLTLNVKRDVEFTTEELEILSNFIESEYRFGTGVAVKIQPLFTALPFEEDNAELPEKMQDYSVITKILKKRPQSSVVIESFCSTAPKFAETRAENMKKYLMQEYTLEESVFRIIITETADSSYLTVSVR